MTLARTGFRKPSLEEVKKKQAAKRLKLLSSPRKARKPRVKQLNPSKGQIIPKKRKEKTQAQLKKELDTVFSLYVRKIYPKICYTCGKAVERLQCGHFVSRQYLATRWDENNCRPQCVGCNIYGNGKPLDFEENLKKELGDQFVEQLKASRHQSLKLDRHWYEKQIAKYKLLTTP